VGYAGGTTVNPTYENIGDYSETVQVDYDPGVVSFKQLLEAFWGGHDATLEPYSRQYRSAIFYTDEGQKQLASEFKQAEESRLGRHLYTDILPLTHFYVAEDYHQKFYLKGSELANDFYKIYPDPAEFRDSTAAARLNGYMGGYGDPDTIKKNLDQLGLSQSSREILLQAAESNLTPGCPVIIPNK
jgi:peptide-methionine (S)-S-oxide reductase